MAVDISHIIEQIKLSNDIFEKARLMDYLKHEHEVKTVELSKELEMQPSYIAHFLRLNKLPVLVVDGYYGQLVSASHLFIIARLPDHEAMIQVYERVLEKNLTAAQTEEEIRSILFEIEPEGERLKNYEIKSMEESMARSLDGAEVKIVQTRVRTRITIEFPGNLEKTARIIRKIHRKVTAS